MHTDTLPARETGLHTKMIFVTPEIATSWLEHNNVNRPMNPRSVEALAWDMRRGKWTLTHQGIAFNTDGLLVDGQHRLRAIIAANQGVTLLVTFNLECTFEAPIDTGCMRKVHHVLGMSHRTVAVCNALSLLESGTVVRSTSTRVGEIHARHERGVTWATMFFPAQRGMTANVLAAHAFAFPVAPDLVERFAAKLISGANIEPDSPVLLLRKYIGNRSRRNRPSTRRAGSLRGACHWAARTEASCRRTRPCMRLEGSQGRCAVVVGGLPARSGFARGSDFRPPSGCRG